MKRTLLTSLALGLAFVALVGEASVEATSAEATATEKLYQRILVEADALVTVSFVLNVKMQGASSDREIDGEITCLVIDPRGLVLCSNSELGGYVGLMARMVGRQGFGVTATPQEIDVQIGDAAEGLPATLVVRDSDRDLVWLQIDGEVPDPLPFLDLTRSAELAVGDDFYRLRRMDKFFGRAPLVEQGKVAAIVDKPRRLLVPSPPSTASNSGLPVFTADGRVVGITVVQLPGTEDGASSSQTSLSSMSSGSKMQDMVGGLVLPIADVIKATRLAREIAAEDEADE